MHLLVGPQTNSLSCPSPQHPLQTEHTATVNAAPVPKARRPPGQSIVNPLNKQKRAAGGVQFNDH